MSNVKEKIDKTEEFARKIWLAGLGAYGQSFENMQSGYEKMSDQARNHFDELVARGEKIESDTKENLDETSDKLKSRTEKLKEKAEELRTKSFKMENINQNINERLSEIRSKVSEKVNMPSIDLPSFGNSKLDELKEQIEDLSKAVAKLAKDKKSSK